MIVVFAGVGGSPEATFLKEQVLLEELGIPFTVVDLAALMDGRFEEVFRWTTSGLREVGLYRGWILHPAEYERLAAGLAARGISLLTNPAQYAAAQIFPSFFASIADLSFPAAWTTGSDVEDVRRAAMALGCGPWFLKDFAKSAKESWPKGCVVERPGTIERFRTTMNELQHVRGDRFEQGFVVRPLLRLRSLGVNPLGTPVNEEYRLVFVGGRRVFSGAYDYLGGTKVDFERFDVLGSRVDSPFFTADCFVTESGECLVSELGDGGCAAMPPGIDLESLYESLRSAAASQRGA